MSALSNAFLVFTALFYLLSFFTLSKRLKYTLLLVFFILACLPFYERHYSFITLLYSFFDTPSLFCVLLCALFVFRGLSKDFSFDFDICKADTKKAFKHPLQQALSFALIFFASLVVFLGELNLIPFDLYHSSYFMQAGFVLLFLVLLFLCNQSYAFLALISLCGFVSGFSGLFESFVDIYLFLYSFAFLLVFSLQILYKRLRQ
ncbi:hypothetical protein DMB95_01105 [Campylobacter sp. MIT 12-8780]|uniref:hypothetical protein n=1 Tax=unclassified Campylobacter TaxID=2593542 RepID=UPI00115EBC20|nr:MULTISPECIES: hypothetical protein [unclassified Campylobacter]NDJ26559.1 hypothetical protein [Campylobacter sp. MIT 19-121]TQR43128.1 hypothetical protein DMB95_01105 [Campylobacter sp. MIT 12-8780]